MLHPEGVIWAKKMIGLARPGGGKVIIPRSGVQIIRVSETEVFIDTSIAWDTEIELKAHIEAAGFTVLDKMPAR